MKPGLQLLVSCTIYLSPIRNEYFLLLAYSFFAHSFSSTWNSCPLPIRIFPDPSPIPLATYFSNQNVLISPDFPQVFIWVSLMVLLLLHHTDQHHCKCPSVGIKWPTQSQDLINFHEQELKWNIAFWGQANNRELKQHQTLLYFNAILRV